MTSGGQEAQQRYRQDYWQGYRPETPISGQEMHQRHQQGQPAPGQHEPFRVPDLVKPRKAEPTSGWRKVVYYGTAKLVNLGKGKAERHQDDLEFRIKRDIRRRYVIAVIGAGAGKTTLTACLGEVFKLCRSEPVLAIDADPSFGTLALRVAEAVTGDIESLLRERDVEGYNDLRPSLGVSRETGLEVLAGINRATPNRQVAAHQFDQVMSLLSRAAAHEIVLIDCGQNLDHPVMQSVLRAANMAVVVTGVTPDRAWPADLTLAWLRNAGFHELVSRSLVVINDFRGDSRAEARRLLSDRFADMTGNPVMELPFDRYLAKGGIIDIKHEIEKVTRLRLFEIAAAVADAYVPESGRPYTGSVR